ncbi:MAG: hypothetical protein ACTSQW_00055 [Promethearchaeota archaeon]
MKINKKISAFLITTILLLSIAGFVITRTSYYDDIDLIVVYSTVGVMGVLTLVLVNSLRPKRFIK